MGNIDAADLNPTARALRSKRSRSRSPLWCLKLSIRRGYESRDAGALLWPFFSEGGGGTGLGLSMVYGTMQRHGGSIEVDSVPRQGTTMRLCFRL
jgi:signal transduction histidine kinase